MLTSSLESARAQLRGVFQQRLAAAVEALALALGELKRGRADAAQSVRRVARRVADTATAYDVIGMADTASAVANAAPEDLAAAGEDFLDALVAVRAKDRAPASRVLLIDADTQHAADVTKALRRHGHEVVAASTASQSRSAFSGVGFDLVILSLLLPDGDGRDLLLELRTKPGTRDLPVIVLSAGRDALSTQECLALGATQVLRRPVPAGILAATVAGELERASVAAAGGRDPLTGLLLRRPFSEAFASARALATRSAWPMALALLDLDHFKNINDRYGHAAGDAVLSHVATHVVAQLRASDTCARWGGEELAICFPTTTPEDAVAALERVRAALAAHPWVHESGREVPVTFSAGVVPTGPAELLEEAIARADSLLYKAKAAGRDKIIAG